MNLRNLHTLLLRKKVKLYMCLLLFILSNVIYLLSDISQIYIKFLLLLKHKYCELMTLDQKISCTLGPEIFQKFSKKKAMKMSEIAYLIQKALGN